MIGSNGTSRRGTGMVGRCGRLGLCPVGPRRGIFTIVDTSPSDISQRLCTKRDSPGERRTGRHAGCLGILVDRIFGIRGNRTRRTGETAPSEMSVRKRGGLGGRSGQTKRCDGQPPLRTRLGAGGDIGHGAGLGWTAQRHRGQRRAPLMGSGRGNRDRLSGVVVGHDDIQLDTEICSNKLIIPGTKTGQLPLYGLVFSSKLSTSEVKQKRIMNWCGMEGNRTNDGQEWMEVAQRRMQP